MWGREKLDEVEAFRWGGGGGDPERKGRTWIKIMQLNDLKRNKVWRAVRVLKGPNYLGQEVVDELCQVEGL